MSILGKWSQTYVPMYVISTSIDYWFSDGYTFIYIYIKVYIHKHIYLYGLDTVYVNI